MFLDLTGEVAERDFAPFERLLVHAGHVVSWIRPRSLDCSLLRLQLAVVMTAWMGSHERDPVLGLRKLPHQRTDPREDS